MVAWVPANYGDLNLAEVAAEAGYTRGALYHLFDDKEDLALAAVAWVWETWQEQVASPADSHDEPFQALVALARGHIAYCRDGRARVMMTLRVEFAEREHPVGDAVWKIAAALRRRVERLVVRGRRAGTISPGPPARVVAAAYLSALEGLAIGVAGRTPHDEALAERVVLGLLRGGPLPLGRSGDRVG
ncbi:MAG TPA: TetR/AcrR family transcriptional regulator [Thermoleophilaceae bacterium]|nr:TetR/AcrR family transcriptional regulator [Thermoleophilaceae bacterium]